MVSRPVRSYVRSQLHDVTVGHQLRLKDDPTPVTLNPRYPLVLTFLGDEKGSTITVKDVLTSLALRFPFDTKAPAMKHIAVAVKSVKVWAEKPQTTVSLTVHPVVGWDGTRQFTDTGNSYRGARLGFMWARDEWNQLTGSAGANNLICAIGSSGPFVLHLSILWIVPYGAPKQPSTCNLRLLRAEDSDSVRSDDIKDP